MPGPGLARLVADLDRKSPAWPPAALTLARIQLHAGDRAHADELARQILSEVNTGPVAEGAQGVVATSCQLAGDGEGGPVGAESVADLEVVVVVR